MSGSIENHIEAILKAVGEDPHREGLLKTPERWAETIKFLTSGYQANIKEIVSDALYHEDVKDIVLVQDIEMFSLCEHHLLPFYGRAHIAYIPNGRVIGLSKIPRIVDAFSRRLQLQERLTRQIANSMCEILNPLGVAVIVEASHLCMMMRGVEKQNSKTVTSAMLGGFAENATTRAELMQLLRK